MNELLRLISNSLKPFGYHVRPYRGLNLLKIAAPDGPGLHAPQKAFGDPVAGAPEGDLSRLVIYFRTCIRDNRNINPRPRVSGAPIEEDTLRCLWSLIRSVNDARQTDPDLDSSLILLDDNSSPRAQGRLRALLDLAECRTEFRTTRTTGQGESLHEQFLDGRSQDALVYFCEDDYLHEKDAISTLWRFYRRIAAATGGHLLLYPQEHNVLYSNHYPSYLFLSEDRHWRSMNNATHTFLTHGKVVERYWDYFENTKFVGNRKKRKKGSEDRTTNRLFRHIPGFSPLKPCAVHLQYEELLPPFYDWRPLWDQSALPPLP